MPALIDPDPFFLATASRGCSRHSASARGPEPRRASDEKGRDTVYRCFDGAALPWIAPVGRLDRASEGLLLFTNDSAWAARLTDPATHCDKAYHVQVDVLPDDALLAGIAAGADVGG